MKTFTHNGFCPIRDLIVRLNSKWAMLVMVTLHANGTLRFGEIRKSIGEISQRMLTVTLRTLEEDGMVQRHVFAEVPPRVQYELTDKGRSFIPVLEQLVGWAMEHGMPAEAGV